ncbi:hypothetical protein JHK82_042484 [Glycine max]|nr:hypothetical protein JHK82_042484 [Glycine max]
MEKVKKKGHQIIVGKTRTVGIREGALLFGETICVYNVDTLGHDAVKDLQLLVEISVTALKQTHISDDQVHRAKRALYALVTAMLLDDNNATAKGTVHTRSFSHRAKNTNTTTRST